MKQIKFSSRVAVFALLLTTLSISVPVAHAYGPGATQRKKQQRGAYRTEISAMMNEHKVPCKFSMDCEALPLGVRACGGPAEFLILSKGTRTKIADGLEDLTKTINEMDITANSENGVMGTCEAMIKPEVACKAGLCVKGAPGK